MLIHQRFEAQAKKTPQATAVATEGSSLSYEELNGRANQVARYLTGRGLGPGARVGVCCERTIELVVAVYGVLKAGAAYVPMDPAYPAERLQYMAEAAGLDFVLTQGYLAGRLSGLKNVQLVHVDGPQDQCSGLGRENLDVPVTGDDLIYIIFTSGTTGRPKGAAVYHRGFSNLLDWFVTEFQINAEDRVLLVSSPSFDLTQKNLYAPLVTGGELHLSSPGPYDVAELAKAIRDHGITLINCTPSAFYPLVDECADYSGLSSLRVVFLGGEPISLPRLRGWLESPRCRAEIANTYGPTECTDICAFYRLTRANMDQYDFIPLGRTVTNVQLEVVNEAMEACGLGEAGELCIGGAGVGAGYVNDPDLTARKFVANPFSRLEGAVIYRTGDQVRWCSEGLLEFLGRKDHQVKVRGFRIELHEIESVIRQHPMIRETVVVVKEGGPSVQLKGYFTAKPGEAPLPQEVREFAASRLPEYMVPASFENLSAFPLSPNGKVDRNALSALAQREPAASADEPVANDLQSRIHNIWTTVLGSNDVGLDDNFFDIGGDSLSLAQVHTRLRKLVGRDFPITELFGHTTVRSLALHFNGAAPSSARNGEMLDRVQRQRQALQAAGSRRRRAPGVPR